MKGKKDDSPIPFLSFADSEQFHNEHTRGGQHFELAQGESKTCKVIDTRDVAARVYWFSCLLPEATHFKVSEMPVIQKEKGVLRLLVIAGSLSHFAGDIGEILLEHWKTAWDHILYVPGPYEYGSGTLCAGDDQCIMLQHRVGQEKVTVFVPGLTDSVLFTGPGLRFLGAPCWPTDPEIYREARVYGSTRFSSSSSSSSSLAGSALLKAQVEMIHDRKYVETAEASTRLRQDVAVLIVALKETEEKRVRETRIVVTYGCPDEQLATTVKHNDPFRGAVSLGSKAVYDYLGRQVDWWIHGAKGDDFRSSICGGNIITLNNLYTAINHLNGDGFTVNFADAIKIERKPVPGAAKGNV